MTPDETESTIVEKFTAETPRPAVLTRPTQQSACVHEFSLHVTQHRSVVPFPKERRRNGTPPVGPSKGHGPWVSVVLLERQESDCGMAFLTRGYRIVPPFRSAERFRNDM